MSTGHITKTGASTDSANKAPAETIPKGKPAVDNNPYRPGSVYSTIFHEAGKRYQTKDEIIGRTQGQTDSYDIFVFDAI